MIIPISIRPTQMASIQNGYFYVGDITGLYLVRYSETAAKLLYYMGGTLWTLSYFEHQNIAHYTIKSSSNYVNPEVFLDFVNHNTPECISLLLWVLPNPRFILSADFKTKEL